MTDTISSDLIRTADEAVGIEHRVLHVLVNTECGTMACTEEFTEREAALLNRENWHFNNPCRWVPVADEN